MRLSRFFDWVWDARAWLTLAVAQRARDSIEGFGPDRVLRAVRFDDCRIFRVPKTTPLPDSTAWLSGIGPEYPRFE
jgi:hypothetical protein